MALLVTGASGFLGSALVPNLLEKGHKVYGLSRHPPAPAEKLIPLVGDITQPNLGLEKTPRDIQAVYHLAAIHRLGEDEDGSIWRTNVDGTRNVIDFCLRHDIRHLFFCSTAYTQGRNTYEESKRLCEEMLENLGIPKITIFKPSIVLGTAEHFYPGHFSQFVALVIKIHQRAEIIRRKIEGTLRLPVIEPVLRIRGNPKGRINLVQIDQVAKAMAEIEGEGEFWLTNPAPPTLQKLCDWSGEFIMVTMRMQRDFKPTPIEAMFQKKGAAFEPYLQGDDFPSHLKQHPRITKKLIHYTIRRMLMP